MISCSSDTLLIWDSDKIPPECDFVTFLWRGHLTREANSQVSILDLIEENADSYRSRYLAFIYQLGEVKLDNLRLIEHLKIRPRLSYWWMSRFVEKCNFFKSPLVNDALKLFAFDDLVNQLQNLKNIKLVTKNQALHKCLKNWCKLNNINFESDFDTSAKTRKPFLMRIFSAMPYSMQAAAWLLRYSAQCWCIRDVGVAEWKKTVSQLTFISYFFNFDKSSAKQGLFESLYWTKLPKTLNEIETHSSWLHIYVKSPAAPSLRAAKELIQNFNTVNKGCQTHVLLESFLDLKTVFAAIGNLLTVRRIAKKYFNDVFQNCNKNPLSMEALILPLYEEEWNQSFFGVEAIKNLLMLNLFEKAFSFSPRQSTGIYLQENQGWEFGMIHAWKESFNGPIIGFPHTTVKFWDLRYFFDPRSFCKNQLEMPLPNFVAASGDIVKNAYLEGGYPEENLVEVEALRYLHLGKVNNKEVDIRGSSKICRKVLVIGDYVPSNTQQLMSFLNEIAAELTNIELTIKPHPACPIAIEDYPDLKFKLSNQSLSDILSLNHIAFTSSMTAGAIDAYFAGLKVVSVLDKSNLNLSPLRGFAKVVYVRSADELKNALLSAVLESEEVVKIDNYFHVDTSLPRWRTLISSKMTSYE